MPPVLCKLRLLRPMPIAKQSRRPVSNSKVKHLKVIVKTIREAARILLLAAARFCSQCCFGGDVELRHQ